MNIKKINNIINHFERGIILFLIGLMGLIVFFTTIELAIYIVKELIFSVSEVHFLLDKDELTKIFGLFFNVLIGLELFETVKLYLREDVLNAEVIILVVLIAVARKVIIINFDNSSFQLLASMAALVLVLSVGYYLLIKSRKSLSKEKQL
ncbi:MAG TPA: phosphate-starvation-inducible PsiE family protein [Salinivirgaceae bacterium]|nr:phosphate-starvation-inducible PsiE family protein [Salinivirgaceae bacterium]